MIGLTVSINGKKGIIDRIENNYWVYVVIDGQTSGPYRLTELIIEK